ncbi:hypothetical protein ACLMJK_006561 [Lecanora helva]
MPRGGKKPGNQHNSRHENGIVAPGKRITKQKSNGHLNGSAEGSSLANGVPVASTTAHTSIRQSDKRVSGTAASSKGGLQDIGDLEERCQDTSKNALELLPNGVDHPDCSAEHVHRKIDVSSAKSPLAYENSILHFALTILRSCPLGDTIAILIFLLSIPPTLLTFTNALFAILTFITPTGASALPTTFSEIFQGSGGTPSLATIFLTDIIGLILWLVMWTPVQSLSLELAQAVVATTLGGGTASKKKGSDRTLLCMSIVTVSHVARHQWIPTRLFGYDWSAILSSIPSVSSNPSFFSRSDLVLSRSPSGWFSILISLHILVQGLVHVARRWYQKRDYAQAVSGSKRSDPEAIAGSPTRPIHVPSSDSNSSAATLPPEVPNKLPATIAKDWDKVSTGKKKRKQGTYVRSQQPLWAAFAHTKVTVLREYEQNHRQSEVAVSGASDTRNLGNAPFEAEDGYVWISSISPTSFRFNTSYFTMSDSADTDFEKPSIIASAGIDRSKPLYVRINDTDWTSTIIERSDGTDDGADDRWAGEVSGLTPSSSYKCSFVQSEDGVVFHSVIVTTPPSLTAERDPSTALTTSSQRSHRPSSPKTPITTLKESISIFESSLNESQTRQKRSKKDNKTTSSTLRREIDVSNSRISKLGGEDKAHFNRHLQWNQHIRQADDTTAQFSGEIELLGGLPEDDLILSRERKSDWDEARNQQASMRDDVLQSKELAAREKSTAHNEATTSQQKRERLTGRRNKLLDQHEKLESANTQGLDEKERKDSEQSARDLERLHFEQRAHEDVQTWQRVIQENMFVKQQTWQQVHIVESAFSPQQMSNESNVDESFLPEGDLPGTIPRQASAAAFRYPAFGSTDQPNSLRSHSGSLRRGEQRPRSTSIRSGTSTYVDFEDEDPAPPMPTRAVEMIREKGRKRSGGSVSGSGSSGSQRDPASPLFGSLAQMSPVGKRSPVWNN